MKQVKAFLNSPYFFWFIIALPPFAMVMPIVTGNADFHRLLHPTGEFAVRFTIITMMMSPLRLMFGNKNWIIWLMRRRRFLGVAAFGYGVLHTIYYVIDLENLDKVITDFTKFGIWTGWIAFLIFIPLGLTSNNFSVRILQKYWKPLQRWTYAAAIFTLVHWIAIEEHLAGIIIHTTPLIILEAYRVWYYLKDNYYNKETALNIKKSAINNLTK